MTAPVTTFEFGHEGTRTGIVVQVDGVSGGKTARAIGELAFELAGEQSHPPVTDPGWWAIVFGWAATSYGAPRVQRVIQRSESTHVTVQVARGRLVEVRPSWPLVRLSPTGPWLDLRGEAALRHGPSDSELSAYASTVMLGGEEPPQLEELARMFELGVLEWHRDDPRTGRMVVRAAGSH